MKRNFFTRSICLSLMISMLVAVPSWAATSSDLQQKQEALEKEKKDLESQKSSIENQKAQEQEKLNNANSNINSLSNAQNEVGEAIDDTNEELVSLLTSIDLIEQEITDKEAQIVVTQAEYDEAKANEDTLYEAMKKRVRFMYEKGDYSYMQVLLNATSFADMLNKAQYINELYDYDRQQLEAFIKAKEAAEQVRDELEEEKSELETSKEELALEKEHTQEVLDQYKAQYADYNVRITRAKQDAAVYATELKNKTAKLSALQSEIDAKQKEVTETRKAKEAAQAAEAASRRAAEEAAAKASSAAKAAEVAQNTEETTNTETVTPSETTAANNTDNSTAQSQEEKPAETTTTTSSAPAPTGAATGSNIANYACNFVGYPYVSGGTSLTNGADCSGFVYAVYKAYGISVPRTSWSQGSYGREVSYEDAQPGDVIYYGGHVAIYLGGGRIVHASTAKTGIKYGNATYRTILSVRRYV